jgi:hypothetical protein
MDFVQKIRSQTPKNPLFHYTSQIGFLGIVQTKSIWATDIRYLNDEEEFLYAMNLIRGELKGLWAKIEEGYFSDSKQERIHAELAYRLMDDALSDPVMPEEYHIFVCSFSEKGDLLSQWRAYCPKANGFSLAFEYNQLKAQMKKQGFWLSKCLYKLEDQRNLIWQLLKGLAIKLLDNWNIIADMIKNRPAELEDFVFRIEYEFIEGMFHMCPVLKNPAFAEEHEWRLISTPIPTNHSQVRFREGKSMIIPYFEFRLSEEDHNLTFHTVNIGPTPHRQLSSISTKNFLSANGVKTKQLNQTTIPYREW